MRPNTMFKSAALFTVLTLTAGCASMRKVDVGSESGSTYAINVANQRTQAMTIYWSDGGEPKMLGDVAPGRSERFIVAGAKNPSISVTGRSSSGSTVGPFSVTLEAGATKTVTLR